MGKAFRHPGRIFPKILPSITFVLYLSTKTLFELVFGHRQGASRRVLAVLSNHVPNPKIRCTRHRHRQTTPAFWVKNAQNASGNMELCPTTDVAVIASYPFHIQKPAFLTLSVTGIMPGVKAIVYPSTPNHPL
jgi:hypothetical protein